MAAYGYVRPGRPFDDVTIAVQRSQIVSAAVQVGLQLAHIFEDEKPTGPRALGSRPVGTALLAKLVAGDMLFVASLNRISRDPSDVLAVALSLKRKGVDLIVLELGLEPITGDEEMAVFAKLLAAAAELHRRPSARRRNAGAAAPRALSPTAVYLREVAIEIETRLGLLPFVGTRGDAPRTSAQQQPEAPPAPPQGTSTPRKREAPPAPAPSHGIVDPRDVLLTQDEAAARLRVSPKALYRLRRAGYLPYIPGNPVKVLAGDVDALIQRRLVKNPEPPPPKKYDAQAFVRRMLWRDKVRAAAIAGRKRRAG